MSKLVFFFPSILWIVFAGHVGSHGARRLRRNRNTVSVSSHVACDERTCIPPDRKKAHLDTLPCGGSPLKDGEKFVRIFHYGANMGCAKLANLEVLPLSAIPARVMGRCLQFGIGEHTPTSEKEPAWANIATCNRASCIHGVVHEIRETDLEELHETEPGYEFVKLSEPVIGYDGKAIEDVNAYIMRGKVVSHGPSRRYGGLVYCQQKESLNADYAEQTACVLSEMHSSLKSIDCEKEKFSPLSQDSTVSGFGYNAFLLFMLFSAQLSHL